MTLTSVENYLFGGLNLAHDLVSLDRRGSTWLMKLAFCSDTCTETVFVFTDVTMEYEQVLLLPGEELDYPLALLGASSCASADPEYFRFCFTFAGLEVAFTAKWPCQADS